MKKLFALVLVAGLGASFIGCGPTEVKDTTKPSTDKPVPADTTPAGEGTPMPTNTDPPATTPAPAGDPAPAADPAAAPKNG